MSMEDSQTCFLMFFVVGVTITNFWSWLYNIVIIQVACDFIYLFEGLDDVALGRINSSHPFSFH